MSELQSQLALALLDLGCRPSLPRDEAGRLQPADAIHKTAAVLTEKVAALRTTDRSGPDFDHALNGCISEITVAAHEHDTRSGDSLDGTRWRSGLTALLRVASYPNP